MPGPCASFIAAARTLAILRYVTGYMLMLASADDASQYATPDTPPHTAPDTPAHIAPAEAHHAWAEAWVEQLGWVGFDVANRICPTDRYVRLAAGLDATYAAPVVGSRRGGGGEKLEVSVEVQQQQSAQQ